MKKFEVSFHSDFGYPDASTTVHLIARDEEHAIELLGGEKVLKASRSGLWEDKSFEITQGVKWKTHYSGHP